MFLGLLPSETQLEPWLQDCYAKHEEIQCKFIGTTVQVLEKKQNHLEGSRLGKILPQQPQEKAIMP